MKRSYVMVFLLLIFFTAGVFNIYAQNEQVEQEKSKFSFPPVGGFFGAGPELNAYTRTGIAFGGGYTFGMDFILDIPEKQSQRFSAGMRSSLFTNFDTVGALELLAFFRYYLPFEKLHLPKEEDGPFVQAELGAVIFMESGYYEYREAAPAFMGGLGIGWRFNLGEHWFIDPSVRTGYPHIWGVNVTAGFKFKGTGIQVISSNKEQVTSADQSEISNSSKIEDTKPTLMVSHSPELFNPEKEALTFSITAWDESGIADWKLEVYQPESKALFYSVSGKENPPKELKWNGKGNNDDTVLSGSDYSYNFTVTDIYGNFSSAEDTIKIDIYAVLNEDGTLTIQVPAIIFYSNQAVFMGLSNEIIENNRRIFDSVANLLNTYSDYRVIVEGHANPTTAEGTNARTREERSLLVLSEARAQRVVEELVRRGVDRSRLTAVGVGVSKLSVPWDDKDNNWKNRKVEFILIKEGE